MNSDYVKSYLKRTELEVKRSSGCLKELKRGEVAGLRFGLCTINNKQARAHLTQHITLLSNSQHQNFNNPVQIAGAILGVKLVLKALDI